MPLAALIQLFPPSRVTWKSPSSVPTQITSGSVSAIVIEMIAPYVSAPERSYSMGPPLTFCLLLSFRVRSGLIVSQCAPPSRDRNRTFPPRYTSFASVAETAIGEVQLNLYLRSDGF